MLEEMFAKKNKKLRVCNAARQSRNLRRGMAILAMNITGGTPVPLPNDTTTPIHIDLSFACQDVRWIHIDLDNYLIKVVDTPHGLGLD
jgi:hypothetical protein